MLEILLNKYDIDYDKAMDDDIEILKKLYLVDITSEQFKIKTDDNSDQNIKNIFLKSIQLCYMILDKAYIDIMLPDNLDEHKLVSYLVLENLLLLEKTNKNELVSFSEFMNNSTLGYDEKDIYKKLRAIIYYSPLGKLYEIYEKSLPTDKRTRYTTKMFLTPIFSKIIFHCESEPYLNFNIKRDREALKNFTRDLDKTNEPIYTESFDVQYNRFKKFFDTYLFSSNANFKEGCSTFFPIPNNSTNSEIEDIYCLELMCYYVLDRLYNLSNLTLISKHLSKNEYQIDKNFMIDLLSKTVLIPDIINKDLYAENILDAFKVVDIHNKENFVEKLDGLKEKYEFYTQQMNFISYVFLPLLSKCFNVVCYQVYKELPEKNLEKDLKKYVIENELLAKYEVKTNTALLDLSKFEKKQKTILLDLFETIERTIFNPYALKFLKHKISIDYLSSVFPYAHVALNAIFQEKIDDSRTATELYFRSLAHRIDL